MCFVLSVRLCVVFDVLLQCVGLLCGAVWCGVDLRGSGVRF